jgi:DNA-binding MarR family transcriptional regulator
MGRPKSDGMTSRQREVLLLLSQSPSYSVGQLASALGITYVATIKLLNRLAAKGLVKRSINEMDRRITDVSLTDEGLEMLRLSGALDDKVGRNQLDRL